jgi:hypothetical protein
MTHEFRVEKVFSKPRSRGAELSRKPSRWQFHVWRRGFTPRQASEPVMPAWHDSPAWREGLLKS